MAHSSTQHLQRNASECARSLFVVWALRLIGHRHRPPERRRESTRFTLQESRLITAKLTVNYKRGLHLLEDTVENRRLRRTSALVSEAADSTITIRDNGRVLPYRLHPRDPAQLVPGVVVAHEHLDGAFAWIAAQQRERDAARLANPKITLRAKQRIRPAAAPL